MNIDLNQLRTVLEDYLNELRADVDHLKKMGCREAAACSLRQYRIVLRSFQQVIAAGAQ